MHSYEKSKSLYDRAKAVIPGGVNSPVRAFKSVGREPIFIESAKDSTLTDVDGNTYIDFIGSWGPMILGHTPPFMQEDFNKVIKRGISYGVPSPLEVEMAEKLVDAYKGLELVRMVNSGTEATMSAIRVARGYTGRTKILKFEGCYHGHSDALLVKSGSGTLTYGVPTSLGVPESTVKDTLVGTYNDVQELESIFKAEGDLLSCVILEPVAGNMGVVPASEEFIKALRTLCSKYGVVLIFDEVITGFRLAYGGASEVYGVEPDMVCFGKIIGGGLPVGAYGGKREIMSIVSPLGGVYQAGTLSGNPLAMHCGIKMLDHLKANPQIYIELEDKAKYLEKEMKMVIEKHQFPVTFVRYRSMPCLFFKTGALSSYEDVKSCDIEAYAAFFRSMLEEGILLPPAQFEGLFLSTAHTQWHLDQYVEKAEAALIKLYS
ncbi:glutamate-1-semialdehyde 2,1-aminomutase [Fusibacter bizertensis]|uniref:Glutamate-1-semialdehyde 2,1-aminomutase n=1 Tax=Fusibacter bizertensis TaxID=1488331 RepID=A0ABT6NGZ9_9FIRM|nr:glutamate-1-semialdehyde 2,1-aminomutase [Fusibacter bizertensis]MDH8679715.1 glutamate-1-semialdehyde 2,1-aminomutase [Fusibacter bizertensis]